MHFKLLNKYYFINTFDTNNFKKQDRKTIIIYRNYNSPKKNINEILKLKKFFKKKGNKFLLANDFKLALKLRLDGVYLPSFYNTFNHLSYTKMKNFDVIIGMYHDQVITPLKTLYNFNAINITLGLPFIRISPDHGTAENISGKKIANPKSLIESIKFFNNINN